MRDQMRPFVGTKAVLAAAMTRGDYNKYRGWTPPKGEDQSVPGRLVEYVDGGEPNDDRHDGYISWSPEDVFERSYRPAGEITFSVALEMLKQGHAVARTGWNGKGMFIYATPGGKYAPTTKTGEAIAQATDDGMVNYLPFLAMKTVDGDVVPWLASQTDLLAEDWELALEWAVDEEGKADE